MSAMSLRLWLARLLAGKQYDIVQRLAVPSIWLSPSTSTTTDGLWNYTTTGTNCS